MEKMYRISHRSVRRASLAVLLIDDLTGAPIQGSNARVWIDGEKPPIKKFDGWNAFLGLAEGDYTLCAEGGTYERAVMTVTVGSGMEKLQLRLLPNRLYRLPPDCIRVEGTAEPGAEITAYSRGKQQMFKLQRDCCAGDESAVLFCQSSTSPEGRLLRFSAPDGSGETLRVGKPADAEGEYSLGAPLSRAYPKIGTVLVPASRTKADDKGRFFAVVRCSSADTEIVIEAKGGSEVIKTFPRGEGSTLTAVLG